MDDMERRLKSEYDTYTCKMIQLFEEGVDIKIMGYGEWLQNRVEPERPSGGDK